MAELHPNFFYCEPQSWSAEGEWVTLPVRHLEIDAGSSAMIAVDGPRSKPRGLHTISFKCVRLHYSDRPFLRQRSHAPTFRVFRISPRARSLLQLRSGLRAGAGRFGFDTWSPPRRLLCKRSRFRRFGCTGIRGREFVARYFGHVADVLIEVRNVA